MSRIIVDSIRNSSAGSDGITLSSDGKVAFPNTSTGKILQVVHVKKTDTFTSNSSTWADVTGLSASVTMSSASNKVLVVTTLACLNGTTSGSISGVKRNSTFIGLATGDYGSRQNGSGGALYNSRSDVFRSFTHTTLDVPGSGTHTYQVAVFPRSYTVYVNRSETDSNSNSYVRGTSELLLMEVAA